LCRSSLPEQGVSDARERLATADLLDSKMGRPQDKQKAPVERSSQARGGVDEYGNSYPELQDLTFGTLGGAVQR
jgi:hypothetical protein